MPNDRAAVAREVLTKAETVLREDGHDTNADVIAELREEFYPAPPAPETVTVGSGYQVWRFVRRDGDWQSEHGGATYSSQGTRLGSALERIASDARVIAERDARIAELERELDDMSQRHTDVCEKWSDENRRRVQLTERIAAQEARIAELETQLQRALDGAVFHEKRAHHAEQERDAARARIAELENELRRALDGTVSHEKQAYEARTERDAALRALEASKHPVATRETVERVALAVRDADLSRSYLVPMHVYHKLARAALTAAGFTLEGGA